MGTGTVVGARTGGGDHAVHQGRGARPRRGYLLGSSWYLPGERGHGLDRLNHARTGQHSWASVRARTRAYAGARSPCGRWRDETARQRRWGHSSERWPWRRGGPRRHRVGRTVRGNVGRCRRTPRRRGGSKRPRHSPPRAMARGGL